MYHRLERGLGLITFNITNSGIKSCLCVCTFGGPKIMYRFLIRAALNNNVILTFIRARLKRDGAREESEILNRGKI